MESTGYTKFPNQLLDWLLAKSPELTKREIVVLLAVVRNTIGWNREKGIMSCRFIANATGLDPANVSKAIKNLENEKILIVDRSSGTAVILLNPDAVVELTTPVVKTTTPRCQNDHGGVVKTTTEVLSNQPRERGQIDNKQIQERQSKEKRKTGLADWLS